MCASTMGELDRKVADAACCSMDQNTLAIVHICEIDCLPCCQRGRWQDAGMNGIQVRWP